MEHHVRVRLTAKGRIVIPLKVREALGLHEGDEVQIRVEDNEIRISTLGSRVKAAQNFFSNVGDPKRTWSEELIEDRRKAAKNE